MNGVRWREDGPEGRCDYCREWWPITGEFWSVAQKSFRMCLACIREYKRLYIAAAREDPEVRARHRDAAAAQRALLMEHGLMGEYRHRWYLKNREKLCADRRERYRLARLAAGKTYEPRGVDSENRRRKAA